MKQLSLFDLFDELQSQSSAEKAGLLEKQSNLSSNITASKCYLSIEDDIEPREFDDEPYYGDIYDEYIDFEVCSRVW